PGALNPARTAMARAHEDIDARAAAARLAGAAGGLADAGAAHSTAAARGLAGPTMVRIAAQVDAGARAVARPQGAVARPADAGAPPGALRAARAAMLRAPLKVDAGAAAVGLTRRAGRGARALRAHLARRTDFLAGTAIGRIAGDRGALTGADLAAE